MSWDNLLFMFTTLRKTEMSFCNMKDLSSFYLGFHYYYAMEMKQFFRPKIDFSLKWTNV